MPNSAGVEVARISVKVSPDTRQFRRDLKNDLEEIERTMKGDIEVNAHLSAAQAKADMRRLLAQLKAEAARGVNVPVDLNVDKDKTGKGGSLSDTLSGLGDDADKASGQVQHLGKSFLGMSRAAWIGVGVIALAAPAVALVSGLLAGLPSLMSMFAAGAGAVALGLDGIKAAAGTLTPAFDALKASVSSTFQEGLTPVFQQLLPLIQGPLTTGMKSVAGGLVEMAQGFTNVVSSSQGMEQIQTILSQTGAFFKGMSPVIEGFTRSFLTLSTAGAQSFSTLLAPLQNFSNTFNEMVNRITSNGSFQAAMQGMSQVLDSLLTQFTGIMETGVTAMGQLGGPLSTLINGFGTAFQALMPALTSVSSLLANVLGTALQQLAPVITALTPAFTTLASTLGSLLTNSLTALGPILTQVATLLGTTLNTALQTLQPMLPGLMSSFQQLANVLVTSLAPHIPALATALGQVVGAVVQLAPMIMSQLVPAFIQLVPKIAEMLPSVVSLAESFAKLMPVIVPLASALLSVAGAAIQVGVSIGGALIGAIANVAEVITGVIAKVAEWVSSFSNGASQIAAKAAELPGMIQTALANLMQIGLEAGKNLVQGLINGIGNMIGSAVSKAKELASSVAGAVTDFLGIHSPSKLFEQYGINVGEGMELGLVTGFQPVIDQAKKLAGDLSKAFEDGTDVSSIVGNDMENLKATLDSIEQEKKRLKVEKNSLSESDKEGRKALQNQIDQLQAQKDMLSYQKDRLKNEEKYGDETGSGAGSLEEQVAKLMAQPVDFAKATGKQFLSDIGINGDGFLSKLLTEGTKYVFNIGSVDEALDIKQRQENNDALAVVGRT
ncbi:tail length tape measure protein [Mycobacterium phage Centaur]|uniref:Tape measure protein n=1 Tax=Mycobacterium phage Centaur TaxID=2488784 RepID=A0A3G8FHS0_9CAUD|nr:tail length tape measure protein [Mycobacterium phage Centaur]AZF93412.1 tape measure protein [Mycobacterium phage Centaur]